MFKRTIAAITILVAMLCLTVKVDAAKPTQWLIYWYVCGTDIETTRIAFGAGTELMSDDPNKLILNEPNRKPGDASRCIREVDKATLSPNVKIFMQAGGTYIWGHEKFRDLNARLETDVGGNIIGNKYAYYDRWYLWHKKNLGEITKQKGKLGRYVYDKDHRDWRPREQLPISGVGNDETDMGSQKGLVSFLRAGQKLERELYSEGNVRRVLIFVDHGVSRSAGLYGVCSDEYTRNILSLKEIHDAFTEVKDGWTNTDEKPFEVIAFDACEMADYETAVALEKAAKYMVASQEVMFGKVMLGYTGLLNELSKNPSMSGAQLGKIICESAWDDSKTADKEFDMKSQDMFTMSVIDLSEPKMDALKNAYDRFGEKSHYFVERHTDNFIQNVTKLTNAARCAETYDNAHFVDLRGFAENTAQNIPELKSVSDNLVAAINNAVIYQRRGDTLNRGGGISSYYPFNLINSGGAIEDFKNIKVDEVGKNYEDRFSPESQYELYKFLHDEVVKNEKEGKFNLSSLEKTPVEVDPIKMTAKITLDADIRKGVESVQGLLVSNEIIKNSDGTKSAKIWLLGTDSGIKENLNDGTFESTFRGKWVMFEGQPLNIFVLSDATRKNKYGKKVGGTELLYTLLMINDKTHEMFISCKYPDEKLTIIGTRELPETLSDEERKKLEELGKYRTINNNLNALKKGDVVIPVYFTFEFNEKNIIAYLDDQAQKIYGKNYGDLTDEQKESIPKPLDKFINLPLGSPITIGDKQKIEWGNLPDGRYTWHFNFINPVNEGAMTDECAYFTVKNGIIVEVHHGNIKDNSYFEEQVLE